MDLYSLAGDQRALGRLGVVFSALVLGVTGLVIAQFNGLFSGDPSLRVQLPPNRLGRRRRQPGDLSRRAHRQGARHRRSGRRHRPGA
ncbi:hypothetical protein G5V59_07425 [Nocardioides sp. W3-2-3]|uniref:hypothetical protein n=1 Tax=Nocardioides convexus TaxID=2712224 RepID=UPI0024182982|nr:hypothetical protein [Nocardioides convexus]NHA00075.1 hypothetical protein [Nocardioides convexus]